MTLSKPACLVFVLANYCLLLSYLSSVVGDGSIRTNATIQCINHEREALLQFKQGIEIDRCGLLSSWGDPDQPDCCTWSGVRCSHQTGHVIMLNLHGHFDYENGDLDPCLQGKVGPSLLELKHLKYLDLSYNDFRDQPIPSFMGSLSNLQHLDLSINYFEGEVPPQLGNLSKLTYLDLSFNYDTNVKGMEWLSRLTLLRLINLSGVDLSKAKDSWLQVVNNFPFLTTLQMDACNLDYLKTIPSSLSYVNSTSTLAVLSLNTNDLYDNSIFQWLFNLSGTSTHLLHVDLSENSIPGPLPRYFGNMHSLSYLDLSNNKLQGQIPSAFWNMHSLVHLDLSQNLNLSSTSTPPKICEGAGLCSLQTLYLSDSNFTGDISSIFHLFSMCPNSSLAYLDLSSNRLQGTLSDNHMSKLSKLIALTLSNNQAIVINISANWIPSFQMDEIELNSCKLGPFFPRWLLTQTNFSFLDISNTRISDSIPTSFWHFLPSRLEILNISHNNIQGTLPNFTRVFYNLNKVDLSSNCLEGAIPSFPENLTELYLNNNNFSNSIPLLCPKTKMMLSFLDVSNNLLSGKLPDCWMNFNQINGLVLGNNNFTKHLPASIGSLKELEWLQLNNNDFSGELPMSMKNIPGLRFLDISHNSFIGHIPPWIGSTFTKLYLLNLRNNKFADKLPLSLCQMSNLQVLDLSANHISGTIPECIYNLTTMKTVGFVRDSYYTDALVMWKRKEQSFGDLGLVRSISMSDNELEGQIPIGISTLVGLQSLDLSRNKLNGSIPSKIGQLTALEVLELSSNQLSGRIPASLATVTCLDMLNLSNNFLSGSIPTSTQLQSFDTSSYRGNPQLCGPPLPNCPGDQAPINNTTQQQDTETDNDDIFPGLYISVVLGFITGFWAVCGSLVLKRSWRHAFFRSLITRGIDFI